MASPAALAALLALALAPCARAATCCHSASTYNNEQVCSECEGERARRAPPPRARRRRRDSAVAAAALADASPPALTTPCPPPLSPPPAFPNWAIAVIVVLCVLLIGAVCTYFCVKHRRNYLKRHPSEVARNRVLSLRRKGLEATPSLAARAAGTKPEAGAEGGEEAAEKGEAIIEPSPSSAARPLGV
jgi:hypothetical protein